MKMNEMKMKCSGYKIRLGKLNSFIGSNGINDISHGWMVLIME